MLRQHQAHPHHHIYEFLDYRSPPTSSSATASRYFILLSDSYDFSSQDRCTDIKVKNPEPYGSNSKRQNNSAVHLTSNKSSAADNLGTEPVGGCLTSGLQVNEEHWQEPSTGGSEINLTHVNNSRSDGREVLKTYTQKQDPMKVLEHVRITNMLESPIATIKGVFKHFKEEELSVDKEELKRVEERLRAALIQFYHQLQLLKHYRAARSYMLIVDNSNLGSSDEVTNLLERVETTFIQKNFILKSQGRYEVAESKSKRRKAWCNIFLQFLFWLLGCEREHREKKRILYFLIGKMQRFTNIEPGASVVELPQLVQMIFITPSLCSWSIPSPSTLSKLYAIPVVSSSFEPYYAAYAPLFTRRKPSGVLCYTFATVVWENTQGGKAIIIRTVYEMKKGKTSWMVVALISSAVATTVDTYWDIVIDWGLLRKTSKNKHMRDRLLLSHKTVYFAAMVRFK
ncbi:hypothetical protein TB2_020573 [Malus domestica]